MTISRQTIEQAAELVHSVFPGTAQYRWPLLCERSGCDVWVKHENHTPVGAFKIRGGLVFMNDRVRNGRTDGVVTATRGNHGQSIATACARFGLSATIVVPHGNSREKNAAMRAQGATLIEHGDDFQEAADFLQGYAAEHNLTVLPSFHPLLVTGVATYGLEFFQARGDLDTVYVPIGMGSGCAAMIAARDALGLKTKIVGVVAERAPAYKLSFEAGKVIPTEAADTMADGMACRSPNADALALIRGGADRVVAVSDADIKAAMRIYYTDTHNVAEGAGAAPLAALLQEKPKMRGRKVGVVLTGGNVDRDIFIDALRQGE